LNASSDGRGADGCELDQHGMMIVMCDLACVMIRVICRCVDVDTWQSQVDWVNGRAE